MSLLDVRNLRLDLPSPKGPVRVLRGVDLTIEAGGSLAMVGESGAGKSMLALALLGLQPEGASVAGSIRLMGRECVGIGDRAMRKMRGEGVSMVFQEPEGALNPVMTIGRQVAEGPRRRGLGREAARALAGTALARVGLDPARFPLDLYPHQLSGGQRQRVMIALCLAMRPKLLVADEPTTALDATVQAEVLALLQDLADKEGMGLLLVTHDLAVAAAMTETVAVLYAGHVVETGPTAAVFARLAHPYTRALAAARPSIEGTSGTPIGGRMPSPLDVPPGCPFAPRCPRADAGCKASMPPLRAGADGHAVACFHPHGGRP